MKPTRVHVSDTIYDAYFRRAPLGATITVRRVAKEFLREFDDHATPIVIVRTHQENRGFSFVGFSNFKPNRLEEQISRIFSEEISR